MAVVGMKLVTAVDAIPLLSVFCVDQVIASLLHL